MDKKMALTNQKLWLDIFEKAYLANSVGLTFKLPTKVVTIEVMNILYCISTEFFYDLIDMRNVDGVMVFVYGIDGIDKFGYI